MYFKSVLPDCPKPASLATTGKTVAEIIYGQADSNTPLGLTTWKNSPHWSVKTDDRLSQEVKGN